jgi:hypothetical protein
MMRAERHDAELLDIRTRDRGGPFDGVMAKAVLLHLTPAEFGTELDRAKDAVVRPGLLACTFKRGRWVRMDHRKAPPAECFAYRREPELRTLLARNGWTPLILDHINPTGRCIFVKAHPATTDHHRQHEHV